MRGSCRTWALGIKVSGEQALPLFAAQPWSLSWLRLWVVVAWWVPSLQSTAGGLGWKSASPSHPKLSHLRLGPSVVQVSGERGPDGFWAR